MRREEGKKKRERVRKERGKKREKKEKDRERERALLWFCQFLSFFLSLLPLGGLRKKYIWRKHYVHVRMIWSHILSLFLSFFPFFTLPLLSFSLLLSFFFSLPLSFFLSSSLFPNACDCFFSAVRKREKGGRRT